MHLGAPNVQAVQEGIFQVVHQVAFPYHRVVEMAFRQVVNQHRLEEGREMVACPWAVLQACLVVETVACLEAYGQGLGACSVAGMAAFRLVACLVLSQSQLDGHKEMRESTDVLLGP
jgi:hypothetical protein